MKTILKYTLITLIIMCLFSVGLYFIPSYLGEKYIGFSYENKLFMIYTEYLGYIIILCTVWLSYLFLKNRR